MRILFVEDDSMIGEAVSEILKDAAYAVDWAKDGEEALTSVSVQKYDLVLLDLGLPTMDGMDVLKHIRSQQNQVPLIILTARDALDERVRGLDFGADDYIIKPFETKELLARMRAVCRRKEGLSNPVLSNGKITLDPATHEAAAGDTVSILSAREFALLQALLVAPGTILSRVELEDRIYGWNEEVESNAVEFLIHSLRKKFGADIIKNVRGVGWMVSKK
ncbi:MAG: response regulator transcription factor [Desulfovibrio desulfuricans]|nr:response regulator transcription factor [Desulfovibrio desulfuricans]